jgi:hypothetical protein
MKVHTDSKPCSTHETQALSEYIKKFWSRNLLWRNCLGTFQSKKENVSKEIEGMGTVQIQLAQYRDQLWAYEYVNKISLFR